MHGNSNIKSREFLIQFCSLKYIAVLNLYIYARGRRPAGPSPSSPQKKDWLARKQTQILVADVFVIIPFVWLQYTYSHLGN